MRRLDSFIVGRRLKLRHKLAVRRRRIAKVIVNASALLAACLMKPMGGRFVEMIAEAPHAAWTDHYYHPLTWCAPRHGGAAVRPGRMST
jgi:hypothetical protein